MGGSILRELKRRRIGRLAAAYAAAAFIAVEAADLFLPRLGLPDGSVTVVVVLAVIGFPVALVLGWVFDVRSGEVSRTAPLAGEAGLEPRRRLVLAAAGGLVAITAAIAWGVVPGWRDGGPPGVGPVQRLAVLPASNLTRDPEQAYFVDGVHEALVTELQRAGLPVVARQSVLRYRESELSIAEIASELGVDALLLPVVGREGDSVLVDVRLYQKASDVPVWGASFSESIDGVLGLYRDVSRRIATEMGAVLSREVQARLAERPSVDPRVYEAVLRGQFHLRRFTPQDFDLAVRSFESALAIDSTCAPAHLGIAVAWGNRWVANLVPADTAKRRGDAALERARRFDPTLADRHHLVPGLLVWAEWDWAAGEAAFVRALSLDPDNAETHAFYAQYLAFFGRWDESEEHGRLAVELDPLNPFVLGLRGTQQTLTGRPAEAIRTLERLYAENPGVGLGEAGLRDAYHQVGRHEDAARITREHHVARGHTAVVQAFDAGLREGGPHRAFHRAANVLAGRSRDVGGIRVAGYYALAGDYEHAFEWVRTAVEQRDANVPVLGILPIFWPLHEDPRFQAIAGDLGLPLIRRPGI